MDGGSADHAGAVICRPAGDHPLSDLRRCHRIASDRPQGGLLQPSIQSFAQLPAACHTNQLS
jgi:hypothetical protein